MLSGSFSEAGFRIVADNALDAIVGTQAASAGYVGANIQAMSRTLHTDVAGLTGTVVQKTDQLMQVNQSGFSNLQQTLSGGFSSLKMISGVSLAVQAAGFAVVAKQLAGVRGDLQALHGDLVAQGRELIDLQQIANTRMENLVDLMARSATTQEKILESLLTSRTVEARQLLQQGWDNLKHGYDDEAFSRFERSLDYDNTTYLAHAQLARLHQKRGDKHKADDHYVRACRFSSGAGPEIEAFARIQYANFLEEDGRLQDSITELRAALERSDKPAWRFHLGATSADG